MTVLENCMIGQIKVLKKKKEEAKESALSFLEKVGMAPYINAKPRQFREARSREWLLPEPWLWSRSFCFLTNLPPLWILRW